jgi:hypothetical protein
MSIEKLYKDICKGNDGVGVIKAKEYKKEHINFDKKPAKKTKRR